MWRWKPEGYNLIMNLWVDSFTKLRKPSLEAHSGLISRKFGAATWDPVFSSGCKRGKRQTGKLSKSNSCFHGSGGCKCQQAWFLATSLPGLPMDVTLCHIRVTLAGLEPTYVAQATLWLLSVELPVISDTLCWCSPWGTLHLLTS